MILGSLSPNGAVWALCQILKERIFTIIDLERRLYDVALARSRFAEDSPKFAELDAIHRQLDEERMKLLLEATDMDLLALEG